MYTRTLPDKINEREITLEILKSRAIMGIATQYEILELIQLYESAVKERERQTSLIVTKFLNQSATIRHMVQKQAENKKGQPY